jgi:hypothetical protein
MTQARKKKIPETVHASCGKQVIWVPRHNGGLNPPVELLGWVWTFDHGNNLERALAYKVHECDPTDVTEWTKLKAAQRAERQKIRNKPYEDLAVVLWAGAMQTDCPVCPAKIGEKCLNLSRLKTKVVQATKWPHDSRIPESLKVVPEQGTF